MGGLMNPNFNLTKESRGIDLVVSSAPSYLERLESRLHAFGVRLAAAESVLVRLVAAEAMDHDLPVRKPVASVGVITVAVMEPMTDLQSSSGARARPPRPKVGEVFEKGTRVFRVKDLAEEWGYSEKVIRELFRHEVGDEVDVKCLRRPEELHKRKYTTMRIKESAAFRVHQRLRAEPKG
jgi:hypothetical protein